MKLIFTIVLITCFCLAGYAQSFSIVNLEPSLVVPHQKTITSTFYIQNYTNVETLYSISLKGAYSQGGSIALICYDGKCDEKNIQLIIPANRTSNEIGLKFTGGLSSFKSNLQLIVDDEETINSITKDIFVSVTDLKQDDIFYSKDEVFVSNFYPNPSIKFANMEYRLKPFQTNVKVVLQNVLGSHVKEYNLDPRDNKIRLLTENLNPGIYFYTLIINEEGLATRKLIVKR